MRREVEEIAGKAAWVPRLPHTHPNHVPPHPGNRAILGEELCQHGRLYLQILFRRVVRIVTVHVEDYVEARLDVVLSHASHKLLNDVSASLAERAGFD